MNKQDDINSKRIYIYILWNKYNKHVSVIISDVTRFSKSRTTSIRPSLVASVTVDSGSCLGLHSTMCRYWWNGSLLNEQHWEHTYSLLPLGEPPDLLNISHWTSLMTILWRIQGQRHLSHSALRGNFRTEPTRWHWGCYKDLTISGALRIDSCDIGENSPSTGNHRSMLLNELLIINIIN